ncbi:MAG TPA: CDP-alcohol phosphatidyltransferase family protein [Saliniramus sp.]|nr:CDP-alcohol phosphatidyltransferase family protein [Saliniramus sp.]
MRYDVAFTTLGNHTTRRRTDTLIALALGGAVLLAAASIMARFTGFGLAMVAGSAAPYAILVVVILSRIKAYHPHDRFGLPNLITLTRAVINCILIGMLVDSPRLLANGGDWLGWFLLGAALASLALDGVDGFFARRLGLSSRFGARFDMEVDAMLLMLLAVAAFALGKVGIWVLAIGAIYHVFRAARAIWPFLARELPPAMRRKAVCVLQGGALIALTTPFITPPLATVIAAVALAALIWSFAVDIVWLVRNRHA